VLSEAEATAALAVWRICADWCKTERRGSPVETEYVEYLERLRRLVDLLMEYQVSFCRVVDGATWNEIGDDMGVSRQAAAKLFKQVDAWPPMDWEEFSESKFATVRTGRRRAPV
jgi:hypothetical protein